MVPQTFTSLQIHPSAIRYPLPIPFPLSLSFKTPLSKNFFHIKSHISNPQFQLLTKTTARNDSNTNTITNSSRDYCEDDDGIPIEFVKTLVKFKSRHNYIRVLEVSRKADHQLAGSRLLLLDAPGNIHSISYRFRLLTDTYFDVFATIPPLLPPGPVGILGFGAGSAARILLEMYPHPPDRVLVHGWELDPAVLSVGRDYFGLEKLEKQYKNRLFIYVGNALNASAGDGFAGILVDLYSKGCVIPELQSPQTWEKLKQSLKQGGRIMVNVGGGCVEPEDMRKDGKSIMEQTLEAMHEVFPGQVSVLNLGSSGRDDSTVALTGEFPDLDNWKEALPKPLKFYAHMWKPYKERIS